ncbi:hypothetical protein Gpo141_00012775 [Globisporangium polare]
MSYPSMDADVFARLSLPTKDDSPLMGNGLGLDANEFELNFLDEFLLHDEFVPSPHSPSSSDDAPSSPELAAVAATSNGTGIDCILEKIEVIEYAPSAATAEANEPPFLFLAESNNDNNTNHQDSGSPTASSTGSDYASYQQDEFEFENADAPSGEPGLDRKAKRRAQVAISARRHRCRKKHEMMDLRKEVAYLDSQLDLLRSKHKMMRPHGAMAEWEEKAMAQRHKRRQTEEKNEELRRAIFLQGTFISNLKGVFNNSPMFAIELNMRQLLHTYTRLGKNPRSRARDYETICSDAKLDMAMDVILRETGATDLSTPSISTRHVQSTKQEFGATTVGVYAFDTLDMRKIFISACAAIRDSGREWPQYAPVDAQVQVVDAPKDNIRYGVCSIRYRSEIEEDEEVVIESRAISYYRVTETYGVLLWDFVDTDDLYPLQVETNMKRDVIGAVLVRREVCVDGVERVVCRSICTKIHSFSLPAASPDIKRFSQSTEMGSKVCGSSVYNSIKDDFVRSLTA